MKMSKYQNILNSQMDRIIFYTPNEPPNPLLTNEQTNEQTSGQTNAWTNKSQLPAVDA